MIADTMICSLLVFVFVAMVVRGRRVEMGNLPRGYDCESALIGLVGMSVLIALVFGLATVMFWFRIQGSFWWFFVLPILMAERIIRSVLPIALGAIVVWGIIVGRGNPYARRILIAAGVSCAGLIIDWGLWWSMNAVAKTIALSSPRGI